MKWSSLLFPFAPLSSGADELAICIARIPSAAQGPEGSNGGARRFDSRLRHRVAHLQQVAVGVQHLDQAHDTTLVGSKGVIACTRERRFTLGENSDLRLTIDQGGE